MSEKIQIENGDLGLTHRSGTKQSDTNYSLESSVTESSNAEPTIDEFKEQRSLKNALKSKVFIATVIACVLLLTVISVAYIMAFEMKKEVVTEEIKSWNDVLSEEQTSWYDRGLDEIKEAIKVKLNKRRAKNVVLFVGDGMGPNTVTAARLHGFKEEGFMTWEKFDHMGMLKTYCADKTVPDSFSTATALFGGVKVNYETGGVDASVKLGDCKASLNSDHHVKSILHMAQIDGMNTGFVTTTRVTHATPAALYAHVPDRRWECEAKMSDEQKQQGCKDIGRILVEDEPGKNINVIMGGGYQSLVSGAVDSPADPLDTWSCLSKDGRNLIKKWAELKEEEGESYAVLRNNSDLNKLNAEDTDFVLGVFSNGHLKYDFERDHGPSGMPSLKDMTKKALEVLKSKKKGFLLVVEGGMIDQAHHRGAAKKAISETLALNEAVAEALNVLKNRLDETLIIVTADHSHTLTINGYPQKGNSIFGIASRSKIDQVPYTSLTYGTGYEGANQFQSDEDGNIIRKDPTLEDTESFEYHQQALIKTDENTHGGADVTVHATGPMAHLFHRTHENTYVSHVIQYALRIGRFRDSSILESLAEFF